jgi:thiamine-phosphate pyrophosphorylase
MDSDKTARLRSARLYVVVSSGLCRRPVEEVVTAALRGGADVIQLREKGIYEADYVALARRLKKLVSDAGRLFVVNDNPSVALSAGADGVHVGQEDVPLLECRLLLGPDAVVGVSTHDLDQARAAADGGADYVGFGPIHATSTKPEAGEPRGLEALRSVCAAVALPVFAIGGLSTANAAEACGAGAAGVAISSAICAAEDPEKATREIRARL